MKKTLFALLSLLLLSMPGMVTAAEMGSGDNYVLPGNEVLRDNLYAAGGTVQLNGSVDGDALVAGGNVTVSNNVANDLAAVGGTVLVLGNVGEDARLAGGNVLVSGEIGGELVVAGGMVSVTPAAKVRGETIVMGGQIVLDGMFEGNVEIRGEEVTISGQVNGTVSGDIDSLVIADGAVISGGLIYMSPKEAAIAEGAQVGGEIVHEKRVSGPRPALDSRGRIGEAKRAFGAALAAVALLKYLASLAAALVLTMWFAKRSQAVVDASLRGFGHNFLIGLAGAIISPISLILLLLTGIGAVLALLGGAIFMALMTLSGIFAGVIFGVIIRKAWTKSKKAPSADWKSVLLGVTLLHLAYIIPIIGPLFKMVLALGVFGAVVIMLHGYLRPKVRR